MDNLITEVRRLIDDTTAPYDYTDEQITRYLDKRRGWMMTSLYTILGIRM